MTTEYAKAQQRQEFVHRIMEKAQPYAFRLAALNAATGGKNLPASVNVDQRGSVAP